MTNDELIKMLNWYPKGSIVKFYNADSNSEEEVIGMQYETRSRKSGTGIIILENDEL